MHDLQTDNLVPKKETSGAWALLIFGALMAMAIALGVFFR